jgi:anaerobic selenocysteine-containing dehydrogenase
VEDRLGLFADAADLELGGRGAAVTAAKSAKSEKWDKVVPYTCLVCNIEDGGVAFIKNGRVRKLEGNVKHPSTRGRLCAKGNAGIGHVYDPDRILYPLRRTGPRGSGKWKRISWEEGVKEVASKIDEVIKNGHPNEVMIKYGRDRSGGAKSRFAATIGTNTVINHTSTCESSKKIGMEPTWGPDIETPDFSNTKYILNFGSNILESAYFMNPYSQRIAEGIAENNAKMVTFDVRLSNTAGLSQEWFPVFPGTDGLVALAMSNVIMQEGLADTDFIDNWSLPPRRLRAIPGCLQRISAG